MQRRQVVLGLLGIGMGLAATAARADSISGSIPKQVTLFGQKYAVEVHSLAGTYTNGKKVTQATDWSTEPNVRKSKVDFVQGATPDKDRLFVATSVAQDAAAQSQDQFYTLTGSDPNTIGQFNPTVSSLEQHWGGAIDYVHGGRPCDVLWLNDTDTGVKLDKNILLVTFTDDDFYRFYDLDSLKVDFLSDEVDYQGYHVDKSNGTLVDTGPNNGLNAPDVGDPNAPFGGFMTFARTANPQYLIAQAEPDSSTAAVTPGAEMGIMDLNTTKFLPVLTNVSDGLPTHDDGSGNQVGSYNHGLTAEAPDPTKNMAPTTNVYWMLYTDASPGGNSFTVVSNQLLRVQIDLPTDLTTAKAGDLKLTTLGTEDLLKSGLAPTDVDPANVIYGLSIGREVTAGSGKRIIYLTDWDGNLLTLTPQ